MWSKNILYTKFQVFIYIFVAIIMFIYTTIPRISNKFFSEFLDEEAWSVWLLLSNLCDVLTLHCEFLVRQRFIVEILESNYSIVGTLRGNKEGESLGWCGKTQYWPWRKELIGIEDDFGWQCSLESGFLHRNKTIRHKSNKVSIKVSVLDFSSFKKVYFKMST